RFDREAPRPTRRSRPGSGTDRLPHDTGVGCDPRTDRRRSPRRDERRALRLGARAARGAPPPRQPTEPGSRRQRARLTYMPQPVRLIRSMCARLPLRGCPFRARDTCGTGAALSSFPHRPTELLLVAEALASRSSRPTTSEPEAATPSWSPDSSRLAYAARLRLGDNARQALATVRPDGTGRKLYWDRGSDLYYESSGEPPAWSPDSS